MTDWTIYNNRIQWKHMTDDEKAAMKAHEGPWECYSIVMGRWYPISKPGWVLHTIYRAVKPKRTGVYEWWANIYPEGRSGTYPNRESADNYAMPDRIACIHIKQPWTEGEGLGDE